MSMDTFDIEIKIGVFDSGKGGTSILEAIKKRLKNVEYFYIADSENCPYGEKGDEELMGIVRKNVDKLEKWGAEIIVIACNTATVRCIKKLREEYSNVKFVGTEPAIKAAADAGFRNILLMATPGTVSAKQTETLVKKSSRLGTKVSLLACPGLAEAVERGVGVDDKLAELITGDKFDAVILGCTHYALIKDKIQKYFPKAKLIDGSDGVARRVEDIVKKLRR